MGSALSATEIVNMALDHLDEAPIQSFDDDSGSIARWFRRNFWPIAWALMRRQEWNFATARALLPALANPPAFEWSYAYGVPVDCLRVLPLTVGGYSNGALVPFRVEGNDILTNASAPLPLRYIRRVDNTGAFDNSFCVALAASLAQKAAHSITGKQSYAQAMVSIAQAALDEASTIDSLEGTPDDPVADYWTAARETA